MAESDPPEKKDFFISYNKADRRVGRVDRVAT